MWFSEKEYVNYLKEDFIIRKYLKKEYGRAFISRIEIARFPQLVNVTVSCAKPGILIGRKGAEIEKLQEKIARELGFTLVGHRLELYGEPIDKKKPARKG